MRRCCLLRMVISLYLYFGTATSFDCAVNLSIESHQATGSDTTTTIRCGLTHNITGVKIVEILLFVSDTRGYPGNNPPLANINIWTRTPLLGSPTQTVDVSGSINPGDDVMSFLSVSQNISAVSDPGHRYYKCVILGFNSQGQPVTASDMVKDGASRGKTCKDDNVRLTEAVSLEDINGKLENITELQHNKIDDKLTMLDTTVRDLDKNIGILGNALKNLQTQMKTVNRKLDSLQNIEDKLRELPYSLWALNFVNSDFYIPSASHTFKDKLYLFTKNAGVFDIDSANIVCQKHGGYLVELEDKEEFDFVNQIVKVKSEEFFAGYTDRAKEGKFVHVNSGRRLAISEWVRGEPNNADSNENCVEFNKTGKGLNDAPCHKKSRFICEIIHQFQT